MQRPKRLAALAVAVAVAAGGWVVFAPDRAAPPSARDAGASGADTDAAVAAAVEAKATAPMTPMPPAPVLETPQAPATEVQAAAAADAAMPTVPLLRDEIADLDRRARAGDAAAACRMAAELLACERARALQPYTDNVEGQARMLAQRGARAEEIDRQIDAALQRQAANRSALARCEGVDESRWPPVARYFGLAARAGHRPSMVQFLASERYRSDQLFRDPGLIALYRAEAPRYFLQLVEAGDAEMLQRWSMSAALPHDILFDVLPPPWNERGLATAMLQQSLQARGIPEPEVPRPHPATPEQEARARQLYARHFAGRDGDLDTARQRMAHAPNDLSHYRCEEAPAAARR